jgi:hypothetical protein
MLTCFFFFFVLFFLFFCFLPFLPLLSLLLPAMSLPHHLLLHGAAQNHSCAPNAVIINGIDGPAPSKKPGAAGANATPSHLTARAFSIAPIKAGEEVCICYRSELLTLPVQRRKQLIYQAWRFNVCVCVFRSLSLSFSISAAFCVAWLWV